MSFESILMVFAQATLHFACEKVYSKILLCPAAKGPFPVASSMVPHPHALLRQETGNKILLPNNLKDVRLLNAIVAVICVLND